MSIQEQMRKGTTNFILLNLLAEVDRPMYGYEIIQALEERSAGFFEFKQGLVYPRLHELEREGFLRAEWEGKEGSRRRKFYAITAEGRHRLEKELQGWHALTRNVNKLLGADTP